MLVRAILFPVVAALAAGLPLCVAAAQTPITRISFSRNPCYGFCPSYSVTLERGGAAKWENGNYVSRLGQRGGRVAPTQFQALARLFDAPTFPALLAQTRQSTLKARRMSDGAGFSLVIERGAQKTEVEDYSFSAPPAFLSIEKKLDEAAGRIKWRYDNTGIIAAPAKPGKSSQIFFIRPAVTPPPTQVQETGRVMVRAGQRFQVTLPPGDYAVQWQNETGSHERKVRVVEGRFASIAL